ncbi:MAG: Signal transduction response regulator [Labilithrix sp.]|nr:Signal transduction response regulator [Labilithrix sp.]
MQPLRIHDAPPPRLVVAAGAEWFQIGEGSPVMLETRVPLRRLLLALAELKRTSPHSVLPVTAAFEAGWPGERASPTAAAMRVYTAVHSLRRFGLRGILVRRRRGYVLDIDVHIAANQSQFPPALSGVVDVEVDQDLAHSA